MVKRKSSRSITAIAEQRREGLAVAFFAGNAQE
jgi:hypothetical protein